MNNIKIRVTVLFLFSGLLLSKTTGQTLYVPGATSGIAHSSNGNIGIGIPNPETPLNVFVGAGGVSGKIGIRIGGLENYSSLEFGIDGYYDGLIRSFGNDIKYFAGHWKNIGTPATENHSHLWYTSRAGSNDWSSMKMILNHDGNLGIGTILPLDKLDVNGGIRSTGLIYSTTDGYAQTYLRSWGLSGLGHIYIEPAGSQDLYLTDSWARTGMLSISFGKTVFESGNVLIGKTAQTNLTYKLDVAGKIRADEIVVNTTGADFVFESTYKLRSLSELEAFIKANKHLPDIAPAKEMQENGVRAGEMQTKLLQKVEELTLYIIEQNKKIEELQLQNKELMELKEVIKSQK